MAERILSLLPAATEWICYLGLEDRLVGISHECDYPHTITHLPRVTASRIDPNAPAETIDQQVREFSELGESLYALDADLIRQLNPDLIVTQTLCHVCAVSHDDIRQQVATLDRRCKHVDLNGQTFQQVLEDAERLWQVTGRIPCGEVALDKLRQRIAAVRDAQQPPTPRISLLEWVRPLFCAGHWTPELIQWAGGQDPLAEAGAASRTISTGDLIAANPEMLMVACCGMNQARSESELRALEKIAGWNELACVQNQQVHAFDGSQWFNRPGPRLVDALEQVAMLIGGWRKQAGV